MEADSHLRRNFQNLFERYGSALRRLCSVYERHGSDRQDLFQEIALAVWTALPRFRADASERTWLYRIAHNVAITAAMRRVRSHRREIQTDDLPPVTQTIDDRHEQLLDAVRRLDAGERELVLLYLEGLTARETGAVLGIREINVSVRLTRVRQRLSAMLLDPREAQR